MGYRGALVRPAFLCCGTIIELQQLNGQCDRRTQQCAKRRTGRSAARSQLLHSRDMISRRTIQLLSSYCGWSLTAPGSHEPARLHVLEVQLQPWRLWAASAAGQQEDEQQGCSCTARNVAPVAGCSMPHWWKRSVCNTARQATGTRAAVAAAPAVAAAVAAAAGTATAATCQLSVAAKFCSCAAHGAAAQPPRAALAALQAPATEREWPTCSRCRLLCSCDSVPSPASSAASVLLAAGIGMQPLFMTCQNFREPVAVSRLCSEVIRQRVQKCYSQLLFPGASLFPVACPFPRLIPSILVADFPCLTADWFCQGRLLVLVLSIIAVI